MVFRGRKSCTMYARMALVISFDFMEDSLLFSAMLHGLTVETTKIILFYFYYSRDHLYEIKAIKLHRDAFI